jgi:hypothetical protein
MSQDLYVKNLYRIKTPTRMERKERKVMGGGGG